MKIRVTTERGKFRTLTAPEIKEESISKEAMLAFAAYLRDSPNGVDEDVPGLAKRFGLPHSLVEDSIRVAASGRVRQPRSYGEKKESLVGRFSRLCALVPSFMDRGILPLSALFGLGIGLGLWIPDRFSSKPMTALGAALIVGSIFALFVCNFVRARLRYAVASGAIAAAAITIFFLFREARPPGADMVLVASVKIAQFAVFAILGSALTISASVAGRMFRIRAEDKQEAKLDRLQLLQRIFNLQERLGTEAPIRRSEAKLFDWIRSFSEHWALFAIALGIALAVIEIAGVLLVGGVRITSISGWQQIAVVTGLFLINFVAHPLAGFVTGDWLKAAVASLILTFTRTAITLIPVPGLGVEGFAEAYRASPAGFWLSTALLIGLSIIGGIGATVDRYLQHKRRVEGADRAALLSEIIRLQQLLATGATEVTVMAVDCVGSTRMKSGADPYAVEISFREFHDFVERIVLRHGGIVRSKAGDMAIAEFQSVEDAYASARTVQSKIIEFDRKHNRLPMPFRVRIGLHCGRILGALEEVQYSNVIDVAAHLEKVAPAGGIALSDDAAAMIGTDQFLELAQEVDGHKVYLSTDPCA